MGEESENILMFGLIDPKGAKSYQNKYVVASCPHGSPFTFQIGSW